MHMPRVPLAILFCSLLAHDLRLIALRLANITVPPYEMY